MTSLTKNNVTKAARVLLPMYGILFFVIGASFLLQKPQTTSTAFYDIPKAVVGGSIKPWGLIFTLIAVVMGVSMLQHHRRLEQYALVAATAVVGFWGTLFLIGGFVDPNVSFTAGVFAIGWIPALLTSIASLGRNERS